MLHRTSEMEEQLMPIVSISVVADKHKCPPGFVPIVKTHDDGSDADLWKDGFGFGIFTRTVRYLAVSRQATETHCLQVVTDLAIISDKEAVPSSFVCIDYTSDSKERALKKKFLCARFTPRNDALDAVSDVIVLGRSKRPPRGYTLAGDLDGMVICFKVTTIPETYGRRMSHSQTTEFNSQNKQIGGGAGMYPNLLNPVLATSNSNYRHSTSDLDHVGAHLPMANHSPNALFRGIDRVPFKLNPVFATSLIKAKDADLPYVPDAKVYEKYSYNFSLERSVFT